MREALLTCLERIKSNPSIFKLDEASTKQCVIQPILRTLGWDFDNPEEVTPEYPVKDGDVDYSLRLRNENKVFIEAKRTGDDLNKEKNVDQLLKYSYSVGGVKLSILTNGVTWFLFLPREDVDWKERKFFTIDIMEQEVHSVIGNFIDLLAKSNVENGQALRNAEALFKGKQRNEALKQALPEAWSKLMDEHDPRLLDLLADTTEKLCGYKPDIEELKKFLKLVENRFLTQENHSYSPDKARLSSGPEKGDIFTCESKGAIAHGKYSSNGFTVLKESKAILKETRTIPVSAKNNRDILRKERILRDEGNFYIFTSDYTFNSPGAATGVVLARSANGNIEWKNLKGQTLGQLKKEPRTP